MNWLHECIKFVFFLYDAKNCLISARSHKVRFKLFEDHSSEVLLDLDALSGLTEINLEVEERSGVKHISRFGVSMGPSSSKVLVPSQTATIVPRHVVVNETEHTIIVQQCYLEVCSQCFSYLLLIYLTSWVNLYGISLTPTFLLERMTWQACFTSVANKEQHYSCVMESTRRENSVYLRILSENTEMVMINQWCLSSFDWLNLNWVGQGHYAYLHWDAFS